MRLVLLISLLSFFPHIAAQAQNDARPSSRHVILCGGPAALKWEKLRTKKYRHDRWWANFIRASTLRMDEIRKAYGKNAKLVWIVYKSGYDIRSSADGKPYVKWITAQAKKRNCQLIWINNGNAAINSINKQPRGSVTTFDFFGHSNRYCFMLDYGSEIMAVSKAWIHADDLTKIRPHVFDPKAICKSWGCHTGKSMSASWKQALGIKLIGAIEKTDYAMVGRGQLPTTNGKWVR